MERETFLEKYIQGELTEKERQEFDALVKDDADFRREVEFHTNLKKVTESEDDDNFRTMLTDFESEARMEKSSTKKIPVKWLAAASIVLLAGLAYFFTIDNSTSTEELFAQNFVPYRNVVHPIVRGSNDQGQKTKAFSAYQKGDYKNALNLLTELYKTEKEPYYLFYRANALIQLNRASEAIPLLQQHLDAKDSLAEKSRWYLAMAYLQMNEKENSIKMLNEVVNDDKFNVEEAKRLLQDLD